MGLYACVLRSLHCHLICLCSAASRLQAAIDTYRNSCEHVDSKYQLLSGKGTSYNAPCASCS